MMDLHGTVSVTDFFFFHFTFGAETLLDVWQESFLTAAASNPQSHTVDSIFQFRGTVEVCRQASGLISIWLPEQESDSSANYNTFNLHCLDSLSKPPSNLEVNMWECRLVCVCVCVLDVQLTLRQSYEVIQKNEKA